MKELQIRTLKETKLTKTEYLPVLVSYALLMTACIKILFSGFTMLSSVWWIYAAGCILAGCSLLLIPQKKFQEYLLPAGMGILFILLFAGFSFSRNGVSVLVNEVLTFFTGKNAKIYLDFPTDGNNGVYYAAALFCGMLMLILIEAFFKRKHGYIILLTIFCMTGCACGMFRIDYGILLLTAGIFCMFFSGDLKISKSQGKLSFLVTFSGVFGICTIITLLTVSLAGDNFSVRYISRRAQQAVHQKIYDEGTNAMPEGNLRNLSFFKKSSETALLISTKEPQKFYLRGMVGEVYTGNAWETLSPKVHIEGEDLFYWLHKNEFYGQTSIAEAMALSNTKKEHKLNVTNVSACQEHQYLPYGLSDTAILDANSISDGTVPAAENHMTYTYFAGSLPEWYETYMYLANHTEQKQVQNYLKLEQSYRDHAYTNDLQLTNSVVGVMERIFGTRKKERSLAEIMVLVRETLEHNLEYKENVTTPNGKNDFLKYTLEQSREGYSVHYATAATMMFRYFGVPARYVEGYYISSEEAKNYAPMEEITITEGHAHAWTEIYLDGIGWIPFEVTPGYIDEEELAKAEQVISDGIGEGAGKSYSGSKLTYKPPKQQENDQKAPERNSMFRFKVKDLISLLLIILLILLFIAIYRILKKRKRLLGFLKEMQTAGNREAITGLFGYCSMLMETCGVTSEELDTVKAINMEARFSNHPMKQAQRQQIEDFTKKIVSQCKQKLSPLKKLHYHYILWLYR